MRNFIFVLFVTQLTFQSLLAGDGPSNAQVATCKKKIEKHMGKVSLAFVHCGDGESKSLANYKLAIELSKSTEGVYLWSSVSSFDLICDEITVGSKVVIGSYPEGCENFIKNKVFSLRNAKNPIVE